ncbi:MAG: secretin N-terminal domain-containing protein [Candidatus Omnitrophica bacterium]|nr:secretin N-terminal domain-containing protein [Candidatus Omnitrophota bacterium]
MNYKKFAVISMSLLLLATPACGEPGSYISEPVEMSHHPSISEYGIEGLKKRLSLDIRSMDINQFLKFLATEGSLNIVTTKNVSGLVSLLINDVTIADALEIALSANNLASEKKENIISIMTNAEYKAMYGVDFYDQRMTFVYQLKYASVKNVSAMLANIKSDIGKVISDESTGTIVIIDTPAKIREMKEVIKQQELPTVTRVYPTETKVFEMKYAKIETIKDELTKLLTPDIGTMRTDTRTNSVMITDLPYQFRRIETMLHAFDRKARQVFIEAHIVEVTLGDQFQWGVDWEKVIRIAGTHGIKFIPSISLPLAAATTMGTLSIQTANATTPNAIIQMLGTVTETRILSNPHLTVEEGKEAKIEVIEKQPYQEDTTTTASGGTTTASKSYQWVNVGITLNVTTRINKDGNINMLIKPEVSSIETWYGGMAQAAGAVPVVKSSNAQTTVNVKDGTTIIIAGMISDNKVRTINKIPFFGDLPVVGKAFQNISDNISRTETIVFLTPKLVEGDKSFLLEKELPKMSGGIRE